MKFSRKGASGTTIGIVVVVVVIVVAAAAYFALGIGRGTSTSSNSSTASSSTSSTSSSSTTSQSWFAGTLQAGGSTFVNPVMQVWTVGFNQFTGGAVNINYQSIGSGGGITGVQSGTFVFAGSDAPFTNSTTSQGTLINIPETLGAVAIFYHLAGIKVPLNLTGPVIADIYLQKITTWNNSAILSINPKLAHNSTALAILSHVIVPVHRQDNSGTTFALTTFLARTSTDWNASGLGIGLKVNWPNSPNPELQGKGSGAVAGYVQNTPYSIGYADSYYAFSNNLLTAAVQNSAGVFLTPTLPGIAAAASADSTQLAAVPTYSIVNAPGATSYPISTFTYILVWQKQSNQGQGYDVAQFLWWVVNQGQSYGPKLYYAQLPASMVTTDEALIKQITYNGVPFIS